MSFRYPDDCADKCRFQKLRCRNTSLKVCSFDELRFKISSLTNFNYRKMFNLKLLYLKLIFGAKVISGINSSLSFLSSQC